MSINLKQHLDLLGLKVRDRITGYEGVVATVGFDLYGCIQAVVSPGLDDKGEVRDSRWFDIARLEVKSKKPVMDRPDFEFTQTPKAVAAGLKGPSDKPPRS